MCGIVGFLDKTGNEHAPVGRGIFKMLDALGCRGPDSAGVALYSSCPTNNLVLRVKLGEHGDFSEKGRRLVEPMRAAGWLREASTTAEYLRLVLDYDGPPPQLERVVENSAENLEVISMGYALEIVKQVGSPQNLEATFGISHFVGSHALGHTRLSTESRVDLSHSQPFWSHGHPDLATVHNGHITNYHKLRRQYEQRGIHFYTENDSEIIGIYLAECLSQGMTLDGALRASLADLDGSFSYLVATADAFGFAKDAFALKPLLFAETDAFVAVATEEIAIRAAFAGDYEVREAQAKEVRTWQR